MVKLLSGGCASLFSVVGRSCSYFGDASVEQAPANAQRCLRIAVDSTPHQPISVLPPLISCRVSLVQVRFGTVGAIFSHLSKLEFGGLVHHHGHCRIMPRGVALPLPKAGLRSRGKPSPVVALVFPLSPGQHPPAGGNIVLY